MPIQKVNWHAVFLLAMTHSFCDDPFARLRVEHLIETELLSPFPLENEVKMTPIPQTDVSPLGTGLKRRDHS